MFKLIGSDGDTLQSINKGIDNGYLIFAKLPVIIRLTATIYLFHRNFEGDFIKRIAIQRLRLWENLLITINVRMGSSNS